MYEVFTYFVCVDDVVRLWVRGALQRVQIFL